MGLQKHIKIPSIVIAVLVIALGYGVYEYFSLQKEYGETGEVLNSKISELEIELSNTQTDRDNLAYLLEGERNRNNDFEAQINEIAGTVGVLDKLSKTDEELLRKYSKVYFLNENYFPTSLSDIEPENSFQRKDVKINTSVLPFLKNLLADASSDGIDIKILSAYRSYAEQSSIKATYNVTYGSGANQFSADQGYSEHQLGTTVDFTTEVTGGAFSKFKDTPAYMWLVENAYKYGFILSYPDGNSYYQYEPWHWRFVGTSLAKHMHVEKLQFYDLDQREIDKYLINLFD